MSEKETYPKGTVKQTDEFSKATELKQEVYDFIKETLKSTSEEAFEKAGYGPVGKYAGEYNDEKKYGVGAAKDKYNITIAGRVKSYFEKHTGFGGKKMISEIHMDFDGNTGILNMTYKTTEQAAFRGYQGPDGPLMVNEKIVLDANKMTEFKKELKSKLATIAKKEVEYLSNTKLGIEDKVDKSINSMVENMNNFSIKDMMSDSFDDVVNKVNAILGEGKKKDKEDKEDNLLLGDTEKQVKTAEERTKEIEEITASGGNAAGGAFLTPSAWKAGGDLDIGQDKKKFEDTNYAKGNTKRASVKRTYKTEGENFWSTVELNPGSGYVPKGMEHNFYLGQHSQNTDSNYPGKAKKMNESLDLNKRKFITNEENEKLGLNKRYISEEKLSEQQQKDRWKKLIDLKPYETIKAAESVISESVKPILECGCDAASSQVVTRGEAEKQAESSFEKVNSGGEFVGGKEVITVPKSDSITNVLYKVFKEDYTNPKKMYIMDMITNNYVINPAYNKGKNR